MPERTDARSSFSWNLATNGHSRAVSPNLIIVIVYLKPRLISRSWIDPDKIDKVYHRSS